MKTFLSESVDFVVMSDNIHVLAVSKTGDNGYPIDQVVEVAVFKVDLSANMMESVYDKVVKQDTSVWSDEVKDRVKDLYGISPEDVEEGCNEDAVAQDLRELLQDKTITAFDVKGDFMGHLKNEPYALARKVEVSSAISSRSSFVYRLPSKQTPGPEGLRMSYKAILPDDPAGIGESAGAYEDAARASAILLELHQRGLY